MQSKEPLEKNCIVSGDKVAPDFFKVSSLLTLAIHMFLAFIFVY
jgi:hypothetical protein